MPASTRPATSGAAPPSGSSGFHVHNGTDGSEPRGCTLVSMITDAELHALHAIHYGDGEAVPADILVSLRMQDFLRPIERNDDPRWRNVLTRLGLETLNAHSPARVGRYKRSFQRSSPDISWPEVHPATGERFFAYACVEDAAGPTLCTFWTVRGHEARGHWDGAAWIWSEAA